MLVTLITVLHIFVSIFLILLVLLQQGKGADMGATFGGGSNTLFGASGADNILTKVTTGTAVCFMATSLFLAASMRPGSVVSGSMITTIPSSQRAIPGEPVPGDTTDRRPSESAPLPDAKSGAPAGDPAAAKPAADAPAADAPGNAPAADAPPAAPASDAPAAPAAAAPAADSEGATAPAAQPPAAAPAEPAVPDAAPAAPAAPAAAPVPANP